MARTLSRFINPMCMACLATAGALAQAAAQTAAPDGSVVAKLQVDSEGLNWGLLARSHVGIPFLDLPLSGKRPPGVLKEPKYNGTPLYGAFVIGNGPHSVTNFVIDDGSAAPSRIFIDFDQTGDLTTETPWQFNSTFRGKRQHQLEVSIHASFGNKSHETESATYDFELIRRDDEMHLQAMRKTARIGTLALNGKEYRIALQDGAGNGLYDIGNERHQSKRPVQLYIDLNGDGNFGGFTQVVNRKKTDIPEIYSLRAPFQIEGRWWRGIPSITGDQLKLVPSAPPTAAELAAVAPPPPKPVLPNGTIAPDFSAVGLDGKPLRISDFRGKVVILDFWASWCGPCRRQMPSVQKIYDRVRSQGVVVLSVSFADRRPEFDKWIAKNAGKPYTFTFGFDPADSDAEYSIGRMKYKVWAIPTMFIVDRKGVVRSGLVAAEDEQIVAALAKVGVDAKGE